MQLKEYLKLEECKHGYTYRISSRNLAFGVYDERKQGFVGIRTKFGDRYLFVEYHYDTAAPFGTVCPRIELEKCPIEDLAEGHFIEENGKKFYRTNKVLFDYLDTFKIDDNYDRRK